jgi:hypothetical protein
MMRRREFLYRSTAAVSVANFASGFVCGRVGKQIMSRLVRVREELREQWIGSQSFAGNPSEREKQLMGNYDMFVAALVRAARCISSRN